MTLATTATDLDAYLSERNTNNDTRDVLRDDYALLSDDERVISNLTADEFDERVEWGTTDEEWALDAALEAAWEDRVSGDWR